MIGYGLLALAALGVLGMAFVFMTARHNDKLDAMAEQERADHLKDQTP